MDWTFEGQKNDVLWCAAADAIILLNCISNSRALKLYPVDLALDARTWRQIPMKL